MSIVSRMRIHRSDRHSSAIESSPKSINGHAFMSHPVRIFVVAVSPSPVSKRKFHPGRDWSSISRRLWKNRSADCETRESESCPGFVPFLFFFVARWIRIARGTWSRRDAAANGGSSFRDGRIFFLSPPLRSSPLRPRRENKRSTCSETSIIRFDIPRLDFSN